MCVYLLFVYFRAKSAWVPFLDFANESFTFPRSRAFWQIGLQCGVVMWYISIYHISLNLEDSEIQEMVASQFPNGCW